MNFTNNATNTVSRVSVLHYVVMITQKKNMNKNKNNYSNNNKAWL